MKLYFKQRFFSWFDSYDIYLEDGSTFYTVEGQLSWGHCLHILDDAGRHIATVKEQVLTLLPRFDFYIGDERVGTLKREFTFLSPAYDLDCCGWRVTGNWLEWDYQILRRDGSTAAVIRKELFHWTDTYTIETEYDEDALCALMVVLAIDADKCGSA
ncbi:MAG TPA: LURP-one-related family protein [Candidatus Gemmiger stercorigallinarum]|nr:LURP-one-related family protein [Candidatus Gemmiger stercorigallinarum]